MAGDALAPGTQVDGYELVRVVGRGGFGITYEARHPDFRRNVAVKEFMPAAVGAYREGSRIAFADVSRSIVEKTLAKFEASAAQLRGLSHPNIVRVYDVMRANGTAYLVMELVEGRSLEEVLRQRGTLTPDGLRYVLEPIMAALAHVHAGGLVHRDVAPDNIMLREDGGPILIDFGSLSARFDAGLTRSVSGTEGLVKQGYTAPEQIAATVRPDALSDVYSCAAVAYRALVGRPPVHGLDRTLARVDGDKADPYEPVAAMRLPGVPTGLARAVDAGLAYRGGDRPRGIAELTSAFGWDEASALPTMPAPKGIFESAPETKKRPRARLVAAAAGIVLLVGSGTMGANTYVKWQDAISEAEVRAVLEEQSRQAVEREAKRQRSADLVMQRAEDHRREAEEAQMRGQRGLEDQAGREQENRRHLLGDNAVDAGTSSSSTGTQIAVAIDSGGATVPENPVATPAWPPDVDGEALLRAARHAVPDPAPLTAAEAAFAIDMIERALATAGEWDEQRTAHMMAERSRAIAMLRRGGWPDEARRLLGREVQVRHQLGPGDETLILASALPYGTIDDSGILAPRPYLGLNPSREVAVLVARGLLADGDARGYVEKLGSLKPVREPYGLDPLIQELARLAKDLDDRGEDANAVTVAAIIVDLTAGELWAEISHLEALLARLPQAETLFGQDGSHAGYLMRARLENRAAAGDGEAALRDAKAIEDYERDDAILFVSVGMARAGQHEAARAAVMDIGIVESRANKMVALADAQMDRGEVEEARNSALLVLEMLPHIDDEVDRGIQSQWLAETLARVGLLVESEALTTRVAEDHLDVVDPGFEIEMALALR